MRSIDPRLLRYARSTRGYLLLSVLLGVAIALLVIAQARLLSTAIVDVAQGGEALDAVAPTLVALGSVVLARAIIGWLGEATAYRTAARAKSELRAQALAHALRLGPQGPAGRDPGAVATLVTRGVDALDGYYARYLPQLVLAVIVPIAVLVTILGQDVVSAIIIAITLPLIPVFMILIGAYTRARVDRQWTTLARLSGHFLDLVAGLPTLKVFGRARMQAQVIQSMGERYRSTTMSVLRISFLSSLVLELLASLSVALVAVTVGLRLAEGGMAFSAALFILILVPEAYLPLRLVGQHFHAAAEGLGAAERVLDILQTPIPQGGVRTDIPDEVDIKLQGVSLTYDDRIDASLSPITATLPKGALVALIGASGGGKSTLLSLLLGFMSPTSGRIVLSADDQSIDLADVDQDVWRGRIGWVPQSPRLISPGHDVMTISSAVRLGRSDASTHDVEGALADAGVLAEVQALPHGIDTVIGPAGEGVSAGQFRRIALARALIRRPRILLLDEPTAALDGTSESAVVAALVRMRDAGTTIIAVAHRPALVEAADVILHVATSAGTAPDLARDSAIEAAWTSTRSTLTGSDF